ncbi:ABC-type Fe3+-siderophore transport system, permease component [Methanocella conradii HZ254]|uniref:Cobalamin import system permease protein BtuC n=1 Tax=Methanocella conradii (strain DSM 24694 / JCM 17849 / CGMCC 1.5162 / HZ254) TaxID=1041930 RepID=H8I8Y4_METCZ|nr:iron ABC transporter permease [Methanocella conradii]AFD00455.1 ABC-type Fe3+-siderophore transport system, permease component [Methanocella conradii HZ254]MDI6895728.1 iron ABC transporter permease [Methanocella conradii]
MHNTDKMGFVEDKMQKASEVYQESFSKKLVFLAVMSFLILFAVLYAGSVGSAQLSLEDVFLAVANKALPSVFLPPLNDIAQVIVINIRLPRILLAILTGMCLAVSGAVMQSLLRNPLVSPFTLGLSSAASFGAAMAIVLGPGILGGFFNDNQSSFLVLSAFVFGMASMVLVYGISRIKCDNSTIILAGVVIGYIFSAGVMFLKYVTNNEKLREITVWLMGGMWGASWDAVIILLPITIIGFLYIIFKSWDLNAMEAGDEVAKNLGVKVDTLRMAGLMVATFIASSCLAFTGVIGFIGLMAPHICRMIIGNDNRFVIPGSALIGGFILLISDTFARTIMSPVELPVGIIMYVLGGVFFVFLILKGRESRLY